jgi:hypothetical protein
MQRAARRGPAVVVAVLIQAWCASTALAQTPQGATVPDAAPPPDSTRMVDLTIIAGGDDADPLIGSIRELLGRLGLGVDAHVVSAAPPPQPPAGLSVWVDLASRYEAVTIVREGRTEVRRTIPRDSSPAIVREEIGEAVRSGVEAQLQADAARNPPPPAAPSAPPAPAPPPVAGPEKLPPPTSSPRWFALDLTVFGGGGPVASNSGPVVFRIGGGVVLGSRRRLRPSLAVTAAYFVPFDANNSNVPNLQAHTNFVSLRAVPSIEVLHTPWLSLNVGAGGGVDIISVGPQQLNNDSTVSPRPSVPGRVDPILTALATAYLALAPSVTFTIIAGTDVDFVPPRYAVDPSKSQVLDPWPVRPFALAGFTFTAVGSEQFAARTP